MMLPLVWLPIDNASFSNAVTSKASSSDAFISDTKYILQIFENLDFQ